MSKSGETTRDHSTFTVPELAEFWHCSADIVYDLLRSGKLKGFKLGREWRISDEARRIYEQTPAETEPPKLRGTGKLVLKLS